MDKKLTNVGLELSLTLGWGVRLMITSAVLYGFYYNSKQTERSEHSRNAIDY